MFLCPTTIPILCPLCAEENTSIGFYFDEQVGTIAFELEVGFVKGAHVRDRCRAPVPPRAPPGVYYATHVID